jgi:uncharacterized protein (TIGR03435 family)
VSANQARRDPEFDGVSVRPNKSLVGAGVRILPDRVEITSYPLRAIMAFAYGTPVARLEGVPDWANIERFDIRATMPPGTERPEALTMLRSLLRERFRLKIRSDKRQMDTYALVLSDPNRGPGAGLHRVSVDCETGQLRQGAKSAVFPNARPACGRTMVSQRVAGGPTLVTSRSAAVTMEEFAGTLWTSLGRPVIDKTNLADRFDVEWTYLRDLPAVPGQRSSGPQEGPSQRAALSEQLGLTLKSERDAVELLIVDSVERPDPNDN